MGVEDSAAGWAASDGGIASDDARTAILVPGMHRSGTSALARVLNLLGCDISHALLSANEFNERGYWEDPYFLDLNDRMFQSAGLNWNSWESLSDEWYASPKPSQFVKEAKALVEQRFATSSLFVIKDPRLARLIPFWRRVLGEMGITAKAVIPLRKPSEVAASLQRRDHINVHQGQLIWLRYNLDAEYHTRGLERAFVTYDMLLDDWRGALSSVRENFTDFTWPRQSASAFSEIDAFLSADLRHHVERRKLAADESAWASDVWTILQRWALGEVKKGDKDRLDVIRHAMGQAEGNFARLLIEYQTYAEGIARTLNETRAELEAQQREAVARSAAATKAYEDEHEVRLGKEQALAETEAALEAAGTSLSRAELALAEKADEVARLAAQLGDRDDILKALAAELSQIKGDAASESQQIQHLSRQLAERDAALMVINGQLSALRHAAEDEERETQRLSKLLADRDEQVFRLKTWLASSQKNVDHYKGLPLSRTESREAG